MNARMIATVNLPYKTATLQSLVYALRVDKHPRNIHHGLMPKDTATLTSSGLTSGS